jgi:hypothetical protein
VRTWAKKFRLSVALLPVFLVLYLVLPGLTQAQFTVTTNDGAITITGYTGGADAVTIPATIDGHPVVAIGTSAFSFTEVASVSIPDSVTSIGYEAFDSCTNLSAVTLPNSITNIAQYAFFRCAALVNVTIPSGVTIMRSEVFGLCSGLTTVTLPASITSIQTGAFENCSSLTAIYFLGNAPIVQEKAFVGVSGATAYYLPGTTGWSAMLDTLPAVEKSAPLQISDVSIQTGQFQFAINGSSNQVVVIEACTDPAVADWLPIGTNTLSGTSSTYADPQWTVHSTRFYRLHSQ